MAHDAAADHINFQLVRQVLAPHVPPVPVNHFSVTRVDNDFLVEPGFFDLAELKQAIDQWRTTKKPAEISFKIPVRLAVNREVLVQFHAALSQMLAEEKEG